MSSRRGWRTTRICSAGTRATTVGGDAALRGDAPVRCARRRDAIHATWHRAPEIKGFPLGRGRDLQRFSRRANDRDRARSAATIRDIERENVTDFAANVIGELRRRRRNRIPFEQLRPRQRGCRDPQARK